MSKAVTVVGRNFFVGREYFEEEPDNEIPEECEAQHGTDPQNPQAIRPRGC
jgi:hypothetical protein